MKSEDAKRGRGTLRAAATREGDRNTAALPVPSPSRGCREGSRFLTLMVLLCAGCVNVAMTCPDKASTVTYKGLSLTGTTSVSCIPALNGGYTIEVGGMNLLALAAAVAPFVAAKKPPTESEPEPSSSTFNF
jgi:hypothetical protein